MRDVRLAGWTVDHGDPSSPGNPRVQALGTRRGDSHRLSGCRTASRRCPMSVRPSTSSDTDRRFPRRFLLAVPGAAAVAGVTQAVAAPAEAAPATATWKLGGNPNVNTDGTNYLGTNSIAPLVFKTMPSERTGPLERMRIAADGTIGIGTVRTGRPGGHPRQPRGRAARRDVVRRQRGRGRVRALHGAVATAYRATDGSACRARGPPGGLRHLDRRLGRPGQRGHRSVRHRRQLRRLRHGRDRVSGAAAARGPASSA